MKKAIGTLVSATIISVGIHAGKWMWEEILREQANKLRDRLINKSEENQGS